MEDVVRLVVRRDSDVRREGITRSEAGLKY